MKGVYAALSVQVDCLNTALPPGANGKRKVHSGLRMRSPRIKVVGCARRSPLLREWKDLFRCTPHLAKSLSFRREVIMAAAIHVAEGTPKHRLSKRWAYSMADG